MDIKKAKNHLGILNSTMMSIHELESAIKFFEQFIENIEEYKRNSIEWGIEDFESKAIEIEEEEGIKYDRTIFKSALYTMIRDHDCNNGITWDTVEMYLNEYCKGKVGD